MKYINASYEILDNIDSIEGIERAARLCYKSEKAITSDSAKSFVKRLIDNQHTAMLEHMNIVVERSPIVASTIPKSIHQFRHSVSERGYILSGNVRAFRNFCKEYIGVNYSSNIECILKTLHQTYPVLFDDIVNADKSLNIKSHIEFDNYDESDYEWCEILDPSTFSIYQRRIHDTMSVKFVCDRAIANEIVRHRLCSFAQESTRYINYNKRGGIAIIKPSWLDADILDTVDVSDITFDNNQIVSKSGRSLTPEDIYTFVSTVCESGYNTLIDNYGKKAQLARNILPLGLKTELLVTANIEEWKHIFNLRALGTTGEPHPQIKELMLSLYEECIQKDKELWEF
jgi:thymidylate synthase (FAD)